MSNWIRVDPRQLRHPQPRQETHRGINLTFHVSPYDIPEAVRGYYDSVRNVCVIQFRYLDAPVPARDPVRQGEVAFYLDKQGQRILSVEIPKSNLSKAAPEQIFLNLQSAVTEMAKKRPEPRNFENYDFANEVLSEKQECLFRDFTEA
jgi:hypothetical protein